MLNTILVVLVVLWLLGIVTSYTMGGFLHLLLVVAVILLIVRLVSGRDKIGTDDPCSDRAALDAACRRGAEYDASRRTRPW